jgi:hypothetical protein
MEDDTMSAGFDSRQDRLSQPLGSELSGLARLAMERLAHSPYLPLRKLTCRWQDGVLALTGRVPTQYLKQRVLALLRELGPAVPMIDQVEVVAPGRNQRPSSSQTDPA